IEASPRLAAAQKALLAPSGVAIDWIENLSQIPGLPLILIANELFDAIPVRQYVKTAGGWRERCVGLGSAGEFCFEAGPGAVNPALLPEGADTQPAGMI